MKKIILLFIGILVISLATAIIISTDLGFDVVTEPVTEQDEVGECSIINGLTTEEELKAKILADVNILFGDETINKINLEIESIETSGEDVIACWSLTYEITRQTTELTITDATIFDRIRNSAFDFAKGVWEVREPPIEPPIPEDIPPI